MDVVKVKAPFALTGRLLPPLFCNTNPVPKRPETVPPIVSVVGGGGVDVPPLPLLHAEKVSDVITTATEINVREFIPSSNPNPSSDVEIRILADFEQLHSQKAQASGAQLIFDLSLSSAKSTICSMDRAKISSGGPLATMGSRPRFL